jgi:hypothetical protein
MTSFEKAQLATGEPRVEYIRRRLAEGAAVKIVHAEINSPGMYGGPAGKDWPASIVYNEKRKLEAVPRSIKPLATAADGEIPDRAPALSARDVIVPPEYEDILTAEDVAEVHAEAQRKLKLKQKEAAKKDLLAKATQDLERESRIAAQRGAAKGDMVDIQIDLAPYAPDLRLDGVPYEHGRQYRVPRKVYNVLMEQMQRSWQHEDSLHGKNDRVGRRTLEQRGLTANNASMVRG